MKKQDILNLIKYYVDKDDYSFRNQAYEIAKEFNASGDQQLANYIVTVLAGANASLTTQNFSNEYAYFEKVSLNIGSLLLPDEVLNDVKGVINAIKNNLGINKFLFTGKPGTGKTETAKYLAKILKRDLFQINFPSLVDSKLGQSGKNIQELFRDIKNVSKVSKCIFLFDEIDSIALDRININDMREMGRITSLFLKEMDDLSDNCFMIATTNLYEQLDKALKRRFDAIIDFNRYSKEDLADITTYFLEEYNSKFNLGLKDFKIAYKFCLNSQVNFYPGDLRNLIKVNLAFSDKNKQNDYLQRLFKVFYPNNNIEDLNFLKNLGLTYREIESLTDISRSALSRYFQGALNE